MTKFSPGGVYIKHRVKQRCQKEGCDAKRKTWKTVYRLPKEDLYALKNDKRVIIDKKRFSKLIEKEDRLSELENEDNE